MTRIVNLFGGPCVGKSTLASDLFSWCKKNIKGEFEVLSEFAKELSYEERWKALECQPYIFGEQLFRIHRLVGKVDFIFNDSPLLLSNVYDRKYFSTKFPESVIDIFKSFDNINYVIEREGEFNEKGRHHNLQEAINADSVIDNILHDNNIPHKHVKRDAACSIIKEDIWTYQRLQDSRL